MRPVLSALATPLSLNPTPCAGVLCNAGGGLGWWLVLPGVGMAVEIYNLSDF